MKPGDVFPVHNSFSYALPKGLKEGTLVKLIVFDHGYWRFDQRCGGPTRMADVSWEDGKAVLRSLRNLRDQKQSKRRLSFRIRQKRTGGELPKSISKR